MIDLFPNSKFSSFNKGEIESDSNRSKVKCKYVHRAERLIHLELKAKFLADNDKCNNCGTMIFISTIFIINILVGGLYGSIYIKKYNFKKSISKLIERENLKFTLFGYCVDNNCTRDISYDFDISKFKFYFCINSIQYTVTKIK